MPDHAVLSAQTAEDCVVDQHWERYDAEDHAIWRTLFERQQATLKDHVCEEYLKGLSALDIGAEGVPEFTRLSAQLKRLTGWEVVAVPGLIASRPFFQLLANRRFPAGAFIRRRDQLDYLEEPDVFHDVFGHVPLLSIYTRTGSDLLLVHAPGATRPMTRWRAGILRALSRSPRIADSGGVQCHHGAHQAIDFPVCGR